jgi:hypothetical protein
MAALQTSNCKMHTLPGGFPGEFSGCSLNGD